MLPATVKTQVQANSASGEQVGCSEGRTISLVRPGYRISCVNVSEGGPAFGRGASVKSDGTVKADSWD